MTQVVGSRVGWGTFNRAGFRRKSRESCLRDLQSLCAKHDRMDLWHRFSSVREHNDKASLATIHRLCETMRKGTFTYFEGLLRRCETEPALERNPGRAFFVRRAAHEAQVKRGTSTFNPGSSRRARASKILNASADAALADILKDDDDSG